MRNRLNAAADGESGKGVVRNAEDAPPPPIADCQLPGEGDTATSDEFPRFDLTRRRRRRGDYRTRDQNMAAQHHAKGADRSTGLALQAGFDAELPVR